jgi:hypothetical protein
VQGIGQLELVGTTPDADVGSRAALRSDIDSLGRQKSRTQTRADSALDQLTRQRSRQRERSRQRSRQRTRQRERSRSRQRARFRTRTRTRQRQRTRLRDKDSEDEQQEEGVFGPLSTRFKYQFQNPLGERKIETETLSDLDGSAGAVSDSNPQGQTGETGIPGLSIPRQTEGSR